MNPDPHSEWFLNYGTVRMHTITTLPINFKTSVSVSYYETTDNENQADS
jgi:hypothetical protein